MEELLIVAICLVLNGLLSAFEMAFVSVSRNELKKAVKTGSKNAQSILIRRDNPERTLSVIQIGITLVGAVAAAVAGVGAAETIQPFFMTQWHMREWSAELLSIVLIVLPLTYFSVVLGELVPKSLALRAPMIIVLKGSAWLFVADRVLSPAVSALEWSTKRLLRFFLPGRKIVHEPEPAIEIENLAPAHRQAVINLAHIESRQIKDIMVPWREVACVSLVDSMQTVLSAVFESGYTRLPVTDAASVTGILHTKEFLTFRESGGDTWQAVIRPALNVKAVDTALSVLRLMQNTRNHMCIVWSPTGERIGIVTMEDILEEFLGEIYDEDEDDRIRKLFAARTKRRRREE
ncbi:MAG: hypothetical protein A2X94_15385 [Bdellovibrionales bacterium GWB1_55_8]|nr:MAG: hypothetical protein A2X94_15385 [Bdellovibrionales bacterium GWB1_55_8]